VQASVLFCPLIAVAPILEDLLSSAATAHTRLVLVPSTADANFQPAYPQWPLQPPLMTAFTDPDVRKVRRLTLACCPALNINTIVIVQQNCHYPLTSAAHHSCAQSGNVSGWWGRFRVHFD
jgi:hypothetical protein